MGSFALGFLAGVPTVEASHHGHKKWIGISPRTRLMAGVGFCGSFTTFSTFSVDVLGMLNRGDMARAFSYVAVNNVGGIAAAFAGFNFAKRIVYK
ncbi:hypothetical protein ACHAW5_004358 [Stephanodiscus triporus]|uniref:Fluoride ion transporter CrcB n=1 Tax=Stephanodiscus triporus TaxID=2934178 RepID=A0ABD3Q5N8_9STRA